MTNLSVQLQNADRLEAIYRQLGATLWRLQELEGAVAQYYVLAALAEKGMGIEAGRSLEKSIEGKTFGSTIKLLRTADKVPPELAVRLPAVLRERNWLVHSSLRQERVAVYNAQRCDALLLRLEDLAAEAGSVLKLIASAAQDFVLNAGVAPTRIEALTERVLKTWRGEDDAV